MGTGDPVKTDPRTDEDLVAKVLEGYTALFEVLIRRYNQRLYRVLRCVLDEDTEVEDAMQESFVRAYRHLGELRGRAKFSTWLTRIAIREALARIKRGARFRSLDAVAGAEGDKLIRVVSPAPNPEEYASTREAAALLEVAIMALPEKYRAVIMMRDVEGMSVEETADCMGISKMNVKVRLHRARALVRRELYMRARAQGSDAFEFLGQRCDRAAENVLKQVTQLAKDNARAM